jgi:hypothetical protein
MARAGAAFPAERVDQAGSRRFVVDESIEARRSTARRSTPDARRSTLDGSTLDGSAVDAPTRSASALSY